MYSLRNEDVFICIDEIPTGKCVIETEKKENEQENPLKRRKRMLTDKTQFPVGSTHKTLMTLTFAMCGSIIFPLSFDTFGCFLSRLECGSRQDRKTLNLAKTKESVF